MFLIYGSPRPLVKCDEKSFVSLVLHIKHKRHILLNGFSNRAWVGFSCPSAFRLFLCVLCFCRFFGLASPLFFSLFFLYFFFIFSSFFFIFY